MIKSFALALRIGAIALMVALVGLLCVVWVDPSFAAVHYRSGKRLYWKLETVQIKAQAWEVMLLMLAAQKRMSDFTVSPGGYGFTFMEDHADCSFSMVIKQRSGLAGEQATEAYLKQLAGRVDDSFKRVSMKSELSFEDGSYRVNFSLKLTDDDFEQALRDKKLN